VITIDGARVKFGDAWALVRASNTQPVLVVRFEARTAERLAEIKALVLEVLEREGVRA
jgi:phosphomannomutase/phosphoglucomutase